MPTDQPIDVTVVIPTYQRGSSLGRTIDRLLPVLRVDAGAELVVVDQTEEPVPAHEKASAQLGARYRQLLVGPPSLPAARNVGLDEARGEIVVFLDDDVLVDDGLLDAYRAAFADEQVGAVAGRVRTPGAAPSASPYRLTPFGQSSGGFDLPGPARVDSAQGCNMGFRVSALAAAGGFDTVFVGNALREDTDAWRRVADAGWAVRYAPEAVVTHLHEDSGGCRGSRSLSEQPELYHNEVVFFLRHQPTLWAPAFLGYLFWHHVLDPEAVKGRRSPYRAMAFATGIAAGLRDAVRRTPIMRATARRQ